MRDALGLCLVVLFVGCERESAIEGVRKPNTLPETDLVDIRSESGATGTEFHARWTGSDTDGLVVGFRWRLHDNGDDGSFEPTDALGVPWSFTTATDTILCVDADLDSFEADLDLPASQIRFWRSYTLEIAAVDDRGGVDPSPSRRSFTGTTVAPEVVIDYPEITIGPVCSPTSRIVDFGWTASDEEDEDLRELSVRTLWVPLAGPHSSCTQTEYGTTMPVRSDDPNWSEWIPYAPGELNRATLGPLTIDARGYFVVQARDSDGAVTPTFEWGRNVRAIYVGAGLSPTISFHGGELGSWATTGDEGVRSFLVLPGQPIEIEFEAAVENYQGAVDATRYGFNVLDPADESDPGWSGDWAEGGWLRRIDHPGFEDGAHSLTVLCRDRAGAISQAILYFEVLTPPEWSERRPLLVAIDSGIAPDPISEQSEAMWNEITSRFGTHDSDIVHLGPATELDLRQLMEYRAVIWHSRPGLHSYFARHFADRSLGRTYHWLGRYQATGGNLLLTGPGGLVTAFLEDPPYVPMIGFGQCAPSGSGGPRECVSSNSWPMRAWCLESISVVRPAVGFIWGETWPAGDRVTSMECDRLYVADLDEQNFVAAFPSSLGAGFGTLEPDVDLRTHRSRWNDYGLHSEEFFNWNHTSRPVTIEARPCQVPMFRWRAVADAPEHAPVGIDDCSTPRAVTGAPVAIASTVYSDTKPMRGSADFLWGFQPLAFEDAGIEAALSWIVSQNWGIPPTTQ